MKLSQEATRVWIAGKPLSPHQTKPNAECLGGAAVASAMPTCLGPAGLWATIGPPLSPAQTVLPNPTGLRGSNYGKDINLPREKR